MFNTHMNVKNELSVHKVLLKIEMHSNHKNDKLADKADSVLKALEIDEECEVDVMDIDR